MTEKEFITVGIILLVLMVVCIVRINLVWDHRVKLIRWIFADGQKLVRGHYLTDVSYEKMIFQLNKWTFKQFYPEVNLNE